MLSSNNSPNWDSPIAKKCSLEQGFEVVVIKDATAAAKFPEMGDGYAAAVSNFKFLANEVVTTDDAVNAMKYTGGLFA